MRIEYELKFRDLLLFNAMHQFLSVPAQLVFGGLAIFIFFWSSSWQPIAESALEALVAYVAMWAIQFLFNVFYLGFGKNRSLLTAYSVEIQPDALYVETRFERSYYVWAGLAKVVSRPRFIAVYTNASAAHILPARAFASPQQQQEFLSALKGKLSAV